jgi:ComEC/Rec2-related protein
MPAPQPRQPCLGLLICAVPGILLSELVPCWLPVALAAVVCFAVAGFVGRRAFPFWLLVFTVFFVRHDLDWRRNPGRFPIDLLSQGVSVVHATAIVTSEPVPSGYAFRDEHYRFDVRVTEVARQGQTWKTDFPAEVDWVGTVPAWGDQIAFSASIAPLASPRNPGEFNLAAYLARKGIFAQLSAGYGMENEILAHGMGNPIEAWGRKARDFLQQRLSLGIEDDPEKAGLIQTITLGVKQETSVGVRELFQHVGALHLFVVNGLHVALLAGILAFLLKPAGIHRRGFALVIIPILFMYALLTGLSPGSVRAAIMASVMFGAAFVERRPFSFNTLAAAALILLLWDTNELFEEGFQFSFGVVAAIMLLANVIQRPILAIGLPDPFLPRGLWRRWQRVQEFCWRRISGLAGVSVAASIGSFPFSAGYFNLVTPSGFIANILLVPVAVCMLAEAIFSVFSSWLGSVALLFNNANWLVASVMLGIVHFFALLPGGHFFVSTSSAPRPECRLTVLDLGPGQAVVVENQGSVWLIDCGNTTSYYRIVRPFLESRGVNRLDGFIVTHGAAPSMGAALDVISDFAPREIVESTLTDRSSTRRAFQEALDRAGLPKTLVESGDQLQLGSKATCTVLYPPAGLDARTAADKSLALRVEYGANRVLLMSDSAFTGEHWLLDNNRDLKAAAVVLDGESNDIAGTDEFISAAHPFAVIRGEPGYDGSASRDRRWAGGLYKLGVTPFLQSATGAAIIDLSQSGFSIQGFANDQRLRRQAE